MARLSQVLLHCDVAYLLSINIGRGEDKDSKECCALSPNEVAPAAVPVTVEISRYRMPGKIKFRIETTVIVIITLKYKKQKTASTIDDDLRYNVTLHSHTYSTCHHHLEFTP